ncbi:hypothetical protein E7T06_12595 [Deinococcus sp. Arct2-2]|uniref:hypothetical protein n=1 Tax=Deinococcus sp. Arct2-2 TaxID=2568653 RepID=UPI0010A3A718|nr:hypothetical protein [Deinococcus sp. Arct2-2]THF69321.1 hypothetical protein E7T06_12595 [Deinococcus sp. Arct2-2]
MLVYLPTRDEVVAFTPDTAVLLLDSGAYDEHLALDAAGQPVELRFPGLSAAFTVDLVQQVLEAARAEGPDTPEFLLLA